MKSSLDRGLATPSIIYTPLVRWSIISLLTASSVGTFAWMAEAQEAANQAPTGSTLTRTPGSLINRATLKLGTQGRDVSELQATLRLLGFYAGVVDGFYRESTAIAVSRFQTAAGLPADGIVGPATWDQLFPPTANLRSSTTNTISAANLSSTTNSAAAFPTPNITNSSNPNPDRSPALATTNLSNSNPNRDLVGSNSSARPVVPSSSTEPEAYTVELPVLRLGMQGSAVSRLQERLQAAGFFQGAIDGAFGPETQNAVQAAQRQYQLEADGIVGPATWSALLR
ncbi:peptidoglycan-binding protein [Trichocoleus sp. FACHB-591]|uniref:peptidoglycan-binding domain-containing protein n=1 Tax=Trichocoleus sp. FACHB-591 TaxID=2692872 RepID=UPI0018EFDD26|nr:peptidoglycan-binding protein [Trichocoleus sp. FACHB-591]